MGFRKNDASYLYMQICQVLIKREEGKVFEKNPYFRGNYIPPKLWQRIFYGKGKNTLRLVHER
jgi:hypothetical protein